MKLFLCRHGETEGNENGVLQGHSSSKLTAKGLNQVEKLSEKLSEEEIDAVYSSDLNRAVKTGEKIASEQGLKLETSKRLREVDRSEFEGLAFQKVVEKIQRSEKEDHLWKPENGESLDETRQRSVKEIEKIRANHEGEKVVIVSHSGTIGAAILGLLNHSAKNSFKIIQDNCAINELEWSSDHGWELKKINETCHLEQSK